VRDRPRRRGSFPVVPAPPPGYHRLSLEDPGAGMAGSMLLIVAPARCYVPPVLAEPAARVWGFSLPLHAVRSRRNWGAGDFTDL
jgi:(1->4)-alpha-D-glucan 1-alpha-D-glucosylmutase